MRGIYLFNKYYLNIYFSTEGSKMSEAWSMLLRKSQTLEEDRLGNRLVIITLSNTYCHKGLCRELCSASWGLRGEDQGR